MIFKKDRKKVVSFSRKIWNYCYDPNDHIIVSIVSVPLMLASLLFIPRKQNPLMKMIHKYVIIFLGCVFVSFVYVRKLNFIVAAVFAVLLYATVIVFMKVRVLRKYHLILIDLIVQLETL